MLAADSGVACTTPFVQCFTLSFANGRIFSHGPWKVTVSIGIGTESPIPRPPILLDRSDLILAGSFEPYTQDIRNAVQFDLLIWV